jgi:hypothetical protein
MERRLMGMPVEHREKLHQWYVDGVITDYTESPQVSQVFDTPGQRYYVIALKVPTDG